MLVQTDASRHERDSEAIDADPFVTSASSSEFFSALSDGRLVPHKIYDVEGEGAFYTDDTAQVFRVDVTAEHLGSDVAGFAARNDLLPNCEYRLDGPRPVTFSTNADGDVSTVRTISGQSTDRATDVKEAWNPVIREGLPNAEYHLDGLSERADGYAVYRTDELGRVIEVRANDLLLAKNTYTKEDHLRHGEAQLNVGRLGIVERDDGTYTSGYSGRYDGGHLLAREFFGAGEELNMVPMPADMNRRADLPDSWRSLEVAWKKHLEAGRHVSVSIKPVYRGDSRVPVDIVVNYSVNGVQEPEQSFRKWFQAV